MIFDRVKSALGFGKPSDPAEGIALPDNRPEAERKADEKLVAYWLGEIEDSGKREKYFLRDGEEAVRLYEAEATIGTVKTPFNILYANTETMAPSLYNATPRPVVQRRFKDEDPLGLEAGKACERMLAYLADTNNEKYSTLSDVLQSAVLEALVPGRGVSWVKYDADIVSREPEQADPLEPLIEGAAPAEPPEPVEDIGYETVCFEEIPWNRFRHGYGKKWGQVPWVCRDHYMSHEELVENFADLGRACKLTATSAESDNGGDNPQERAQMSEEGQVSLALVHEVWDKRKREVVFVSEGLPDQPLKRVPDPLGLSGFFPCPKPLTFVVKISSLTPVSLYAFYKEQAEELNNLTRRAKGLIAALKFRGFYDGTVTDIDKVLQAEENTLIPADNVASLQPGRSLDSAIWTVPIDMIAATLQQVMVQREACKAIIYEITGMSDIIRGSSVASETATAQTIKSQWGSLRIKRLQKEVQRYAKDLFRLAAEVGANKLEEKTWKGMTGMPFPTGAEKEQAQSTAMQAQGMGMEVPPELAGVLAQPSWTEILSILRDSVQRQYRIDIETNSTVDAEATEDKEMIGELLNAIAQFMSGVSPLIESGVLPFQAAQSILMAVVRRFRFGPEIEETLKLMQAPKPKDDGKAQAEQLKQQSEMQKMQFEQQSQQMEMQGKQQELQQRSEEMAREAQYKAAEHAAKMEELQMNLQIARERNAMELAKIQAEGVAANSMPPKETSNAPV